MSERRRPPYRAEHVGSLLRPAELYNIRLKEDNTSKWAERGTVSTPVDAPSDRGDSGREKYLESSAGSIIDSAIRGAMLSLCKRNAE